jgi:hypothetical protein
LLPMDRTLAGIHIEYDTVCAIVHLRLGKHVAVDGHQPHQVLLARQQLGLEPMQRRRQSLRLPNRAVVRFYNKRGTAEQWIKEGKQAAHWTRLSCHRFRANEVRLQLSVLAYNLGTLWRRLVLPKRD